MNPSESGTEDTLDPYAMRSVAGQAEVIANVDHAYGRKLDALASMRDRAYHELTELMPTSRSFGFSNALLVMLLGHAIGVLDAARILMEHGYGRHALGFIRTLVDLEIDALLVAAGGGELLERYPAYERWETAITGARGLYMLDTEDPEVLEGIRFRVADLTHALEEMGVDVSEIDDTDLVGALEEFGRRALQRPYPRSWRDHLILDDLLDIVAPAHVRIFDPGVEGPDPDAFQAAVDQFKRDYKRCKKRGYDLAELRTVMEVLITRKSLDERHRDHELSGEWKGHRDCHVRPDWVLIYCVAGDTITFERTGTHSDLFE